MRSPNHQGELSGATRILATLGPASWDRKTISELIRAGASGFRLSFSHGKHEDLAAVIGRVRSVADELHVPVALLGDLGGPKLRTGTLAGGEPVELETGSDVVLSPRFEASSAGRIAVDPVVLESDIGPGSRILIDDGRIELTVLEMDGGELRAVVDHGGRLGSHKGLNLPGVHVRIPSLTDKDRVDIRFALEQGIDFLALSFVRNAADVVDLKRNIAQGGHDTPVIAKIEMPLAVQNLDAILEVSDGIMVARGDLGVELGPEVLPVVQKEIIEAARLKSKLVMTATQMLESMTRSPRPTRAEATDVANAILDGTDVVMLSEETAVGRFPVRAVRTMRRIAASVEGSELFVKQMKTYEPEGSGVTFAAIRAACVAAEQLGAQALMPFTSSGWTAFAVAAWRPTVPIIACTPHQSTLNRLALCWGGRPVMIPEARDLDDLYLVGVRELVTKGYLRSDDVVVMLSGSVVVGSGADTIKIFRVSERDLA